MSPKHYDMQLIREVHYQITHSIPLPINLALLISETNISPTTFIKYYRQMFNTTPALHRLELMMEYAEKRLKEGEPIKKVAHELGYTNTQNFSRVFKRVRKIPPSRSIQP
jgi:AraC-like DNA-binding protein